MNAHRGDKRYAETGKPRKRWKQRKSRKKRLKGFEQGLLFDNAASQRAEPAQTTCSGEVVPKQNTGMNEKAR